MSSLRDDLDRSEDLYSRHRATLEAAAEVVGQAADVLQVMVKNGRFDDVAVHETPMGLTIADLVDGVDITPITGTGVLVVSGHLSGADAGDEERRDTTALYGHLAAAVRDHASGSDLAQLDEAVAAQLARDAVDHALGAARSRRLLGEDRLDTTDTALLLGITRQALHKKVRGGTALGVPGRGTTWFPSWQFTPDHTVRPVVARVLAAFAAADPDHRVDPWNVLSWADTPQPELDGTRPAEVISDPDLEDSVVEAAAAAARNLAQ